HLGDFARHERARPDPIAETGPSRHALQNLRALVQPAGRPSRHAIRARELPIRADKPGRNDVVMLHERGHTVLGPPPKQLAAETKCLGVLALPPDGAPEERPK